MPTEDRIQTRGIPLASRCHCCLNHQEESMQHLFLPSKIAMAVWKCFGDKFRMPYTFHSLPNAIAIWMTKAKLLSSFDMCKTVTATHIFKEIWNSRCRALFQRERMPARRIATRVMHHIQMTAFIYSTRTRCFLRLDPFSAHATIFSLSLMPANLWN